MSFHYDERRSAWYLDPLVLDGVARGVIWGNMAVLAPGALVMAWLGHVVLGVILGLVWMVTVIAYIGLIRRRR